MNALTMELSEGLCPLPETFTAMIRLFGSKGFSTRGLELLAAMEKLTYDIRLAWLVLIEELIKSNHLADANKVFLKGAEGKLKATDEIYDLLIEEDCKVGDHSNALTIAYKMEEAGRMATTYHFNCLLSCQIQLCSLWEVVVPCKKYRIFCFGTTHNPMFVMTGTSSTLSNDQSYHFAPTLEVTQLQEALQAEREKREELEQRSAEEIQSLQQRQATAENIVNQLLAQLRPNSDGPPPP